MDVTWARVTLGGDTGDWLDFLFLEVFVGGLFPLAGHGGWGWAAELTDSEEEGERDGDTEDGSVDDLLGLSWWWESAWAVWAESNPVG